MTKTVSQINMVQIPSGTFTMGSPEDEPERSDREAPQHQVTVSSFFMSKYPITQAQYESVMGENPSYFQGKSLPVEGDNLPVERVSWYNAVEFCNRLSQHAGKPYRLPSEAEWEYACRAGTTTPFYFGPRITPDLANYDCNRNLTTEVGSFPPNAFGLYDMHGNVREWCQDVWHDSYEGAPTDGTAWMEGGSQNHHIVRGGSWFYYPRHCRSASRHYDASDVRSLFIGFRVACAA